MLKKEGDFLKKFVLIPDSFKGTLSSTEICETLEKAIRAHHSDAEVVSIPVADGGEGSVDCFLTALGGEKVTLLVNNPYMEEMSAYYGLIDNGQTAVIEMAACAGLPLVETRKNPLKTTTYGVGELMLHAAEQGVKKIVVGLGGSSTNDGGCGAAAAAGVLFYNDQNEIFVPTGGTLKDIVRIDVSKVAPSLKEVEIVTMCDIDNPMYGPTGAAHVFGPQKGADKDMVFFLDAGVKHLAEVIQRDLAMDLSTMPGTGAAGAMGAGMVAFFHSNLQMGIETVLDTVNFEEIIQDADYIFTGEGKIDFQSLRGKVVIGVAKRAKKQEKKVVVIAGGADQGIEEAYELGVTAVFTINRLPEPLDISRHKSRENLYDTADNILRILQ